MTDITRKLQSLLDSQVGKGGLHNIVAAVQSYDQSLDFVGAAGVADACTGAAMTPETPYFIASVTKMYTAAIIMQLHQEKRLDLEFWITPLPEFIGHSGSTGSFAFACPSRSLYITGTLNVITPARPFFFMMNLVRAVS